MNSNDLEAMASDDDPITQDYTKQRIKEIRESKNLHEIGVFYRDLIQFIEECNGEVYPEVLQTLNDYEDSFNKKVDALRVIIRENRSRSQRDRDESAYFAARAQAADKAADWAEYWIIAGMQAANLAVAGERFPQRRQTNGRPSIKWERLEPIPEEFRRVRVELDGDAAYDAWKRGQLPEGFDVNRGEHLRDVITPKRQRKGK